MSKKISKIEKFNYQNIVTLNQSVADKRFLILDLWEDIRSNTPNAQKTSRNADQNRYNQIFLQINDLHVLNFSDGKVYFDLTDRDDVIDAITSIEVKIMSVLKNYLASIHKKGKFNFRSVIKDDRGANDQGNIVLALNLSNQDYEAIFYDIAKKRSNCSLINKQDAAFNVILELMYINFDMKKGEIVADTRLRMCMETRIRLTDVDMFIQDEKKSSDNHSDTRSDENPSRTQSVKSIKQSFDITQTDVFEDDDEPQKNTKTVTKQSSPKSVNQTGANVISSKPVANTTSSSSKGTSDTQPLPKTGVSAPTPKQKLSPKSFEELERENMQSLNILDEILAPSKPVTKSTATIPEPKPMPHVNGVGSNTVPGQVVPSKQEVKPMASLSSEKTVSSEQVDKKQHSQNNVPGSTVQKQTAGTTISPTHQPVAVTVSKTVQNLNLSDEDDDVFSQSSESEDEHNTDEGTDKQTQKTVKRLENEQDTDLHRDEDDEEQDQEQTSALADDDDDLLDDNGDTNDNQEDQDDEIVESLDEEEEPEVDQDQDDDELISEDHQQVDADSDDEIHDVKQNKTNSQNTMNSMLSDAMNDTTSDDSDIMANLNAIYKQTEINRQSKKEAGTNSANKPTVKTEMNLDIKPGQKIGTQPVKQPVNQSVQNSVSSKQVVGSFQKPESTKTQVPVTKADNEKNKESSKTGGNQQDKHPVPAKQPVKQTPQNQDKKGTVDKPVAKVEQKKSDKVIQLSDDTSDHDNDAEDIIKSLLKKNISKKK